MDAGLTKPLAHLCDGRLVRHGWKDIRMGVRWLGRIPMRRLVP